MSSSHLCDELVGHLILTSVRHMKLHLPRFFRKDSARQPERTRLRFYLRSVLLAVLLAGVTGQSLSPAWADDQTPGFEQVLNSDDAKKDRVGAPNGNTLVLLKTAAASDVAKRQRVLDRLAGDLSDVQLDCGQNAALTTRVADTAVLLTEIAGRIAAATEMKVAKAAAAELFPTTRVFSVVNPQVEVALICGDVLAQSQRLQARFAAVQLILEPIKAAPEAQNALAQSAVANAAVKAIPSLATASQSVAGLLPDKGDVTVANNNAAAFDAIKRPIREAVQAVDSASKLVKELERLADLAAKKTAKATKPKKQVK
jgi:hypothetical protein